MAVGTRSRSDRELSLAGLTLLSILVEVSSAHIPYEDESIISTITTHVPPTVQRAGIEPAPQLWQSRIIPVDQRYMIPVVNAVSGNLREEGPLFTSYSSNYPLGWTLWSPATSAADRTRTRYICLEGRHVTINTTTACARGGEPLWVNCGGSQHPIYTLLDRASLCEVSVFRLEPMTGIEPVSEVYKTPA